jgi:hypothetical protein
MTRLQEPPARDGLRTTGLDTEHLTWLTQPPHDRQREPRDLALGRFDRRRHLSDQRRKIHGGHLLVSNIDAPSVDGETARMARGLCQSCNASVPMP